MLEYLQVKNNALRWESTVRTAEMLMDNCALFYIAGNCILVNCFGTAAFPVVSMSVIF